MRVVCYLMLGSGALENSLACGTRDLGSKLAWGLSLPLLARHIIAMTQRCVCARKHVVYTQDTPSASSCPAQGGVVDPPLAYHKRRKGEL